MSVNRRPHTKPHSQPEGNREPEPVSSRLFILLVGIAVGSICTLAIQGFLQMIW